MMKEKLFKLITLRNLIIASVVLLLIIGSVFFFSRYFQDDGIDKDQTEISGFPEGVPDGLKRLTFAALYDAIELNIPSSETPPTSGAVIRENTLETGYNDVTNIFYGKFIIDIAAVKQSFSVRYEWSNNSENTYLSGYPVEIICVERDQRIYDTSSCNDMFHDANQIIDDFAYDYLPYTDTVDGIDFSIIKDYLTRDPEITVVSYTCEGSADAEKVKKAADSWIRAKSDLINPEDIRYKNYCDGMMDTFPALVEN